MRGETDNYAQDGKPEVIHLRLWDRSSSRPSPNPRCRRNRNLFQGNGALNDQKVSFLAVRLPIPYRPRGRRDRSLAQPQVGKEQLPPFGQSG